MGGDGASRLSDLGGHWGSPPRGRGRPHPCRDAIANHGLTPAWAGTASTSAGSSFANRAHPRVGGDGQVVDVLHNRMTGSPPRGRGRPHLGCLPEATLGLTPAWAGTARGFLALARWRGAHPRVGGDGPRFSSARKVARGSPSRGRGRLDTKQRPRAHGGLTPAWAGTARGFLALARWRGAHPRVGGDGWIPSRGRVRTGGSPPRGRGRHRPAQH